MKEKKTRAKNKLSNEKNLWDHYGTLQKDRPFSFGPHYSYQFRNSRRHIIFSLSRYKFAMKMAGPGKKILELGCSEGLGIWYMAEFAKLAHGVDFDGNAIDWAKKNLPREKLTFTCDDFIGKKYGEFDAVVSFDVMEHIYKKNEKPYFKTISRNLKTTGVCIVGTPNIEAARFSRPEVNGAHVNMYSAQRLISVLECYFHNVFLFCQNDEIIHTGFTPMANYLICLCCYPKQKGGDLTNGSLKRAK